MGRLEQTRFAVVAIGASAGGLNALERLLTQLPPDFPVPLVIVQHLAPTHVSMMAHILSRYTALKVKQAASGDPLRAGHVYVAPPDHHVVFTQSSLLFLTESAPVHFVRPSVDVLLTSLAEQFGPRGIAVILTGAGKDGATGLRAVKDAGGVTIVQDPETAAYPSMPEYAIATEGADYVVALDRIPALLVELTARGEPQ